MPITNLRNEAVQLHRQGQLAAARQKYEDYLSAHPDDADMCHAYGVLLGQSAEYALAKSAIEKAIDLKSNQAPYYNSLGNVLNYLGETDKSISAYQSAIKKQPTYPAAYNNLGRIYLLQEKYHSARQAFEKAIQCNKKFADAHCNLGLLCVREENDSEAVKHLKHALKLNPNFMTALRQLSDIHIRNHQFEEAANLLGKCIQLAPDSLEDYVQLGTALFQSKQYSDAIKAFENVLRLDPKHPEANQFLANSLLASGDFDTALNYYFRQLNNTPMMETYYNIGSILMAKDRLEDAQGYLLEAEKKAPDDLATQLNLGSLYLKQQNRSSAILHYQKAARLNPKDEEIQHILAALTQDQLPDKAPSAYLEHLFDHYAPYYDKHLTTCLKYDTPSQIRNMLELEMELGDAQWKILDLGCGTGLSGAEFKRCARHIIGVDLSEKMLLAAKEKQIYDELIQKDIEQALKDQSEIDLIIAADVFTYIGDLSKIFEYTHLALNDSGLFAFSVEKVFDVDYTLQTSIRYAHSKKYLRELISKYAFKELRFDDAILRKQKGESLLGYLVLLQK